MMGAFKDIIIDMGVDCVDALLLIGNNGNSSSFDLSQHQQKCEKRPRHRFRVWGEDCREIGNIRDKCAEIMLKLGGEFSRASNTRIRNVQLTISK